MHYQVFLIERLVFLCLFPLKSNFSRVKTQAQTDMSLQVQRSMIIFLFEEIVNFPNL